MRRSWCWCAGSWLAMIVGAAPLPAATLLEKSVDVEIRPDAVTERTHLRVRLDSARDLSEWSPYPIPLDENRELGDLTASAVQPDGKTVKVSRREAPSSASAGSIPPPSPRSKRSRSRSRGPTSGGCGCGAGRAGGRLWTVLRISSEERSYTGRTAPSGTGISETAFTGVAARITSRSCRRTVSRE